MAKPNATASAIFKPPLLTFSSSRGPPLCLQALENLYAVTLFQGDVRLFPIWPPSDGASSAPFLAEKIRGANLDYGDLEQIFDYVTYLVLACTETNSEHDLVALLSNDSALFGDQRRYYDSLGAHSVTPGESSGASLAPSLASSALAVLSVITNSS